MGSGKGWISLHRKLQDHWLWDSSKPFDKRSAWIDILLLANHKENKVYFNSELVIVNPGEHITSEVKLADRWGWSRTKVRNFLELLEQDDMIKNIKKNKKRTRLKVLNYGDYQGLGNNRKTTEEQEENNRKTTEKQQKNINNNENNELNENNIPYKEIVNYLNQKTDSRYQPGTKKTKRLIKARWNEGFDLEDFKKVIDVKCSEWIGDNEMSKYLRPPTLFGTKFESYLNQPSQNKSEKMSQKEIDEKYYSGIPEDF